MRWDSNISGNSSATKLSYVMFLEPFSSERPSERSHDGGILKSRGMFTFSQARQSKQILFSFHDFWAQWAPGLDYTSRQAGLRATGACKRSRARGGGAVAVQAAGGRALPCLNGCGPGPSPHLRTCCVGSAMPSGGDQSPPPPPPPPAAGASDEEEDDDGEAEDAAQPAGSPTPQIQLRFDELCSRLNMDEAARAEAWDSYRSMSESYTLEVRSGWRLGAFGA